MEIQKSRTRSGRPESVLIFMILLTGFFIFNNLSNRYSERESDHQPGISSTVSNEGLSCFSVQTLVFNKFWSPARNALDKCVIYINSRAEDKNTDCIVNQQIAICQELENVPFISTLHPKILSESDDIPDLT